MTLDEWVKAEQAAAVEHKGEKPSVLTVLTRLADAAGVSVMTIRPVAKGSTMGLFDKALAVSRATGWKVSVPELCMKFPSPEALSQFQALAQVLNHEA
jgi:hypothetical protein